MLNQSFALHYAAPMTPAPAPIRILRQHSTQISTIHLSGEDKERRLNERVYTGDADGVVVTTSTRTFRPLASWQAHNRGILGVEEWGEYVLTHGRDNKLHAWSRIIASTTLAETASPKDLPIPPLLFSLDVNALNFCRFSLWAAPANNDALIALPNLVESSMIDIWTIPASRRLHAAIGKDPGEKVSDPWDTSGRGTSKTGTIMSVHLYSVPHPSRSGLSYLRVLTAYENGGICLWARDEIHRESSTSIEGRGWYALWQIKVHADSVMGLAVSPFHDFAISVSADHLVVRYNLLDDLSPLEETSEDRPHPRALVRRTKYPGNGAVTIRPDGKVFAVAGWDGKVRLYSAKSLKSLGTLDYHTGGCQSIAFAHEESKGAQISDDQDDADEFDREDKDKRGRWLISGGVDKRVALWELMDFERR